MILKNDNDLIGDFIGTIPAMIELSKRGPLEVVIKDGIREVFNMIPGKYGIKRSFNSNFHDLEFDLHAAFALADRQQLHMIQANFAFVGLAVPETIPRPELEVKHFGHEPTFDYILAPFSRSLPPEQKWPRERWQHLVDSMPDKQFALLGNGKFDNHEFITGKNVTAVFSQPLPYACRLLQKSKSGLISVVTGISHMAHALGVTNYLFVNQGTWGKNPDAICLDKHIPDITVEEVLNKLSI